jgi:uncharacterized repeat protein (TIGR04076 family)
VRIRVEIVEVRGKCPVYEVGDSFLVEMPKLVVKPETKVCVHAFIAIQTFLQALARGYSAKKLGIGSKDDEGYVQCPDPGPPYTSGGTVIFKLKKLPNLGDE